MFWVFKLSFVVDILAFFDLATFWAIFQQIWRIFFLIISSLCSPQLGRDDQTDKKISWDDVSKNYKVFVLF